AALMRVPLVIASGMFFSFAVVASAAHRASLAALVRETADLLLWRRGPIVFQDELARLDLAIGLVGVAILVVVGYLLFRPLAAPRDLPDPALRELAGDLVRAHGSDTLAYFKLRHDKHYLFTADRRAFLG